MDEMINQQIRVDARDLRSVKCACGNEYFTPVSMFKILPSLYSNTGKEELIALPFVQCSLCEMVSSMEELKNQKEIVKS